MTQELEHEDLAFRSRYLGHDELMAQLRRWAERHPTLLRLEVIGTTPQDRELVVVTVGRDPTRIRPGAWIDANMHASEFCGTNVCLGVIDDLLALHLDPSQPRHGLSAYAAEVLRESLVYVMPRVSPDGAQAVLDEGRFVRSVPRHDDAPRETPHWRRHDVDGDGRAMSMRVEDPSGEFVASAHVPDLMVRRTIDDDGPYFHVYPEGTIEHYDGDHVPSVAMTTDNGPDLNRNFPYHWAPEPDQVGAGSLPLGEPESRALAEYARRHPNLYVWCNLHTFGGVFIRPLGAAPDSELSSADLALFRQLEQWAREYTGYVTVSGYEEFTYAPGEPLHGDLVDFAFHQRGCLAWTTELWDLFGQLGLPRQRPFVLHYSELSRSQLEAFAAWDAAHNEGRVVQGWQPFDHPQLGPVEVGGLDPRVGIWNPPTNKLAGIIDGMSAVFLRTAAMVPRVRLVEIGRRELAPGLTEIELQVDNLGYLSTAGVDAGASLPWAEPPTLRVQASEGGLEVVSPGAGLVRLRHLAGWGRGEAERGDMFFARASRGSESRTRVRVVLRGHGIARVEVRSPRTGAVAVDLAVGDGV